MYERRLKIFFGILIAVTLGLLLRAGHVQIVASEKLREKAEESLRRTRYLDTARGAIRDFKGRVLAVDQACMVAAVEYRAVERNEAWMKERAIARLGSAYRRAGRQQRQARLEEEKVRLNADLDEMWRVLAQVGGKSREEMEEIQFSIRQRVEQQKRYLWYRRFREAVRRKPSADEDRWFGEWLAGGDSAPQLDNFSVEVSEESEAHVVLGSISTETHNWLRKQLDRFPGLVLRPSKHREYPMGELACHVLGRLSLVSREDVKNDPNLGDDLRNYRFADLVGRMGVEALCEQALRGTRGRVVRSGGDDRLIEETQPVAGRDVTLTIDSDLQGRIEKAFQNVQLVDNKGNAKEPPHEMHGAAVVIDVPTGQVRALVSCPTYDVNTLDETYATLVQDDFRRPLLNRATQVPVEPGSTVKPMVGLGAITDGIWRLDQKVECTGYLYANGKRVNGGRCWTAGLADSLNLGEGMAGHHQMPYGAEHPDGFLTFPEALERSCNIFFETVGGRLQIGGLARWYDAFGLGRKTGIGIAENGGRIPDPEYIPRQELQSVTYFSAIGQTQVAATPIQMANMVATIARNGIWMRPRLLLDMADARPATQTGDSIPDRVDLHLSPAALAAAREGMTKVVNSRAGTGRSIQRTDMLVAGKTGTAQGVKLARHDKDGKVERENGHAVLYEPSVWPEKYRADSAWYRMEAGTLRPHHAWFIGFAPARNPQIAFAVLMQYGDSGGTDAGPIARMVLDACVAHGYLRPEK
jgi:penicillin-binding protein 2